MQLANNLLAPRDIKDTDTTTAQILEALNKHLAPKPSKWAHRLALRKRIQKPGESAADFLVALRQLAYYCEYKKLEDTVLEYFIEGPRDGKLRKKIVGLKGCELMKALDLGTTRDEDRTEEGCCPCHQAAHQATIDPATDNSEGEEVLQMHQSVWGWGKQNSHWEAPSPLVCTSCGDPHERSSCHFCDATCRACRKPSHLARVCRSKTTGRTTAWKMSTHSEDLRSEELHSISTRPTKVLCHPRPSSPDKITVRMSIEGSPCEKEHDTGSAI